MNVLKTYLKAIIFSLIKGNYYDEDDDEIYEEEKKSVDKILSAFEEETENEKETETKANLTSGPAVEPEPVKGIIF